jgi:hypothetical protein
MRPQELPGTHRPPARRPQWQETRGWCSKWLHPTSQTTLQGVCKPQFVQPHFFGGLHSDFISFSHSSSSSAMATAMGTVAYATGTTVVEAAVRRLQGRLPAVSPGPLRESLKTCWRSQRRSLGWHRSRCQRWCLQRLQRRGQQSPHAWRSLPHSVVHEHHSRRTPHGCCLGRCNRRGNGGGNGTSHPLRAERHSPR